MMILVYLVYPAEVFCLKEQDHVTKNQFSHQPVRILYQVETKQWSQQKLILVVPLQ